MEHARCGQLILGKPALGRARALLEVLGEEALLLSLGLREPEPLGYGLGSEVLDAPPYEFDEVGGYLVLYASEVPEGRFSRAARAGGGFAVEAAPDSGGPGWATDGERAVELDAWTLPEAGELYRSWAERTPPVGPEPLEAFRRAVLEALGRGPGEPS